LFPVERITPRQAYLSHRLAERVGRAAKPRQWTAGRPHREAWIGPAHTGQATVILVYCSGW
jgi:hypothetical protein